MAGRNGAGIFTVTNPDFVSGTTISSSEMDANFSDVATGITQSIAADGQTTITANLPMNSKKLTGLAVGSAAGDSVTYGQVWGGVGIKGADLTSAEPLVIGTDGNYFDVTGAVGIATHTVATNRHYFTQFDGACILTHHATTQDLPGEANITTAAGDVAEWQSTGANTVQCVNYTRADGTAVVGAVAASETVSGIVELATTIEAAAGTDTARAVTAAGVAAAITAQATSGATTAEKSNIMLNSFRIEEQGGLTVQGMVDGVSDVFTDESGVDTATSTDEVYNAAGDYYENPTESVVADNAGTVFGDMTSGGGLSAAFDGVTSQTNVQSARKSGTPPSPGYIGKDWGVGQTKTISQFHCWGPTTTGFDNDGNTTVVLTLYGSNSAPASATNGTSLGSASATDSGGLLISKTTGLTATPYRYHWIHISHSTGTGEVQIAEVQFYETLTSANSVIVSETFTALSQPDTAFVAIWHEDVDACTPNTDFTVEASRDAGTTWTAGTLALGATLGAAEILTCSIDISAQPAGTSMRWRVKFFNGLSQRLRGVAMQWS